MSETFTEWRVTGKPGHGHPDYDFVWSPDVNPSLCLNDAEQAARRFVHQVTELDREQWEEGPVLSCRSVTRTRWEVV